MFKKIFGINTEKENSNNVNVDDLYGEIDVLKEEIESLLDVKEKKEKEERKEPKPKEKAKKEPKQKKEKPEKPANK